MEPNIKPTYEAVKVQSKSLLVEMEWDGFLVAKGMKMGNHTTVSIEGGVCPCMIKGEVSVGSGKCKERSRVGNLGER